MTRLRTISPWLAIALAVAALSGVAAAAPRSASAPRSTSASASAARAPFTLGRAQFSVIAHRLTYELTICTPAKSVLRVTASFAPVKRARGVTRLTPGTVQYQDHGCWPAFVSAALARSEPKHCPSLSCPAIIGRRYRATVTVVFAHPRESRRARVLQALA
jgi:hypothetical protein